MEILKDKTGIFWSVRGVETFGPSQITPQPPSLIRRIWEGTKNPSVILMSAGSVPVVGGAINNLPEIGQAGWGLILAGVYLELVRRENHFHL